MLSWPQGALCLRVLLLDVLGTVLWLSWCSSLCHMATLWRKTLGYQDRMLASVYPLYSAFFQKDLSQGAGLDTHLAKGWCKSTRVNNKQHIIIKINFKMWNRQNNTKSLCIKSVMCLRFWNWGTLFISRISGSSPTQHFKIYVCNPCLLWFLKQPVQNGKLQTYTCACSSINYFSRSILGHLLLSITPTPPEHCHDFRLSIINYMINII